MDLSNRFEAVRQQSLRLAAPLSAEDCCVQSMPEASPSKWHLAHTSWFFETFLLEPFEAGFKPFHPAFRVLFNSYYNGVGDKHPRAQRGLLTRPDLDEVLAYRAAVDQRILALLQARSGDARIAELMELGLQHEQQHQELMLTDLLHLLAQNPLQPAYRSEAQDVTPAEPELGWLHFAGGLQDIGHRGGGFCFDNELPSHQQFLQPFELATRLVSNAEFLAFVEAGGYHQPELWLAEGWDWLRSQGLRKPLYWRQDEEAHRWLAFGLHGLQPLDPHAPACHLSLFEADAFARWAGARLPTEFEWEAAARAASQIPALQQMHGQVWQWTSSSYAPFPGFAPAAGAVGEYNGKFMVNQYVLRGSSLATPAGHARDSYRNFFPAHTRWQFSGIRLARSVPA
ncbi:ergothioneine biosynthesis protein EgtB [Roseateles sp. PN1]|uniref:ergothioneine biosynthesis protein EgtB n=1 Tax=Roseateles sp. PN1 TaxID=3137372 RepID=UPI0031397BE1